MFSPSRPAGPCAVRAPMLSAAGELRDGEGRSGAFAAEVESLISRPEH